MLKHAIISVIVLSLLPTFAFAHVKDNSALPTTAVQGLLNINARHNDRKQTENGLSGALSESHHAADQSGLAIDDAQLVGYYKGGERYSVSAKLAYHPHEDNQPLALENLWLSYSPQFQKVRNIIEVGRLTSLTTPLAYFHSAESYYSEASLSQQILFAGHHHDNGVRLRSQNGRMTWGIELWQGNSWPSNDNQGAGSGYIGYTPSIGAITLNTRAWGYYGQSNERGIFRANADQADVSHSHDTKADVRFTGNTRSLGALLGFKWGDSRRHFFINSQWFDQHASGHLDTSPEQLIFQRSPSTHDYQGMQLESGIHLGGHRFAVHYEKIILGNTLENTVTQDFFDATGLKRQGGNPKKWMASWNYAFHRDFSARLDYIYDQTEIIDSQRISLGIIWNHYLSHQ